MAEFEVATPKLRTKPSLRGLNTPTGARPKSNFCLARSATISTPSPPSSSESSPSSNTRSSPGRGAKLTVRIEDDMTTYAQLIKSAPVKTIRKLPIPPMPATAVEGSISSRLLSVAPRSEYAEPHSAPAALQTPLSPRMVRPLPPCPPPPYRPNESSFALSPPRTPTPESTSAPVIVASRSLAGSPPPVEGGARRVVKPLPVPVIKVEPKELPRKASTECSSHPVPSSFPSISPASTPTATPSRPKRTAENASAQEKHKPSLSLSEDTQKQLPSTPKREPDVIHLKFRHKHSLSLDSDTSTSEDDDDDYGSVGDPTFRHSRVTIRLEDSRSNAADTGGKGVKGLGGECVEKKADDLENFVDYSWMLSNRKLYQLDALTSQQMAGGKWLWEKKGKRITEQDFENILHMLRTL
ncbi:hypothetical protein CVT26_000986 [Gymnopilus dilepis]|uniref:Uncharacterized protein n=1 Tax=Gymnopilus dilepis TaxID=231916 RepID=A0A409YL56_9AGAR|nr:hypothetical protein CVT26_000986 [Gymnopilus dilepis]